MDHDDVDAADEPVEPVGERLLVCLRVGRAAVFVVVGLQALERVVVAGDPQSADAGHELAGRAVGLQAPRPREHDRAGARELALGRVGVVVAGHEHEHRARADDLLHERALQRRAAIGEVAHEQQRAVARGALERRQRDDVVVQVRRDGQARQPRAERRAIGGGVDEPRDAHELLVDLVVEGARRRRRATRACAGRPAPRGRWRSTAGCRRSSAAAAARRAARRRRATSRRPSRSSRAAAAPRRRGRRARRAGRARARTARRARSPGADRRRARRAPARGPARRRRSRPRRAARRCRGRSSARRR